jgi:hypothetical protein
MKEHRFFSPAGETPWISHLDPVSGDLFDNNFVAFQNFEEARIITAWSGTNIDVP